MRPKGFKDRPIETLLMIAVLILYLLVFAQAGCIGSTAKIEQTGQGNKSSTDASQNVARIDRLVAQMDATFKLLESLQLEARAGTQETTESSTVGGDQTKADAQQAGAFNFSWQDAGTAGGIGVGVMSLSILLYSLRKNAYDMKVLEEKARLNNELIELWDTLINANERLLSHGKQPMSGEHLPRLAFDSEPCARGWLPWSKCGREGGKSK